LCANKPVEYSNRHLNCCQFGDGGTQFLADLQQSDGGQDEYDTPPLWQIHDDATTSVVESSGNATTEYRCISMNNSAH